jgi:Fe-S-cluster containining protein
MSPCETCHAGCCRSFAVPVSGADILQIQRDLGLSFWKFACRWADPQGNIARNYAPHFHFEDEPETPFVVCLLHEESQFLPGTSKCRFLMESPPDAGHPLGVARCGIYHSRPSACRAFPTKLNRSGELAVIYDVPERGRQEEGDAYQLCPRQWEPDDLDPVRTIQELVVAKYEMNFFHQIAAVWNREPRPWQLFPEFLNMLYAERIQLEDDTLRTTIPLPHPAQPLPDAQRVRKVA